VLALALAGVAARPATADDRAGWEGEIVWRSGLVEPARIVRITADGEVSLVSGSHTFARPFDGLVDARRLVRPSMQTGLAANGLHLVDHAFLVGEVVVDGQGAHVAHAQLGALELPMSAIAAWGARLPVVYRGTPTIRAGGAPVAFARLVRLGDGRLAVAHADGAVAERLLAGVYQVALAAPEPEDEIAISLDLACGSRLRGIRLAFDGARFSLDTRWLGRVTVAAEHVVGFSLGPARFEEGLLVVCEYEGGSIFRQNLVTGEVWRKDGFNYPNVFFRLTPNRWLVSNSRSDELIWIDGAGKELGKIGGLSNPWSVERDRDGNLLVTSCNDQRILLLSPDGRELHVWKTEKSALRAKPLANGNILVAMTYDESLVELDRAGRKVWEWRCGARPVDVELLENGNYLACLESIAKVVEVTRDGKVVWEFSRTLKNPYDADRLGSGNTLIADRGSGRVLEVRPTGEIVWEMGGLRGPVEVERR